MKLETETVCLSLSLGTGSCFSLNAVLLLLSFMQHLKCKNACKWAHKHMIVRATHAHVCLHTFLCFYMIHISWRDVRKKTEQLTSQGRHYFLVLPRVLRQHSQSPRQPRIQPPWCCFSATVRCRETWVGGEGGRQSQSGWVSVRVEHGRRSPILWSRQTLTHLRLQRARLSRLQFT